MSFSGFITHHSELHYFIRITGRLDIGRMLIVILYFLNTKSLEWSWGRGKALRWGLNGGLWHHNRTIIV